MALRLILAAVITAVLCAGASSGAGATDLCDLSTVDVTPRHGPVGTRVHITAKCVSRNWDSGYGIFLIRQVQTPRECEIIAGGPYRFHVGRDHVGRGWFTVASSGACFQHRYRRKVTPGLYRVGLGCHACSIAHFRVTV